MSLAINFVIVYVSAVLAAPVIGNYTDCLCNLNHDLCINSKCATDTTCQRVATVTNNRIFESDDMFCSQNGSHDDILCNTVNRVRNRILVRYCCEGSYCNANNTHLFDFITSQLGDQVSDLLNTDITPSATAASNPTSTDAPASKNESSDKNSSIWIIIALITIIFVTVQIVCVSIALIIGCRKFK